jgi:hypothetical protein
MLFYKKSEDVNGIKQLSFTNIFKDYKCFKNTNKEASVYNCIYYCHFLGGKKEVFSVLKIKSNEEKPRYLIAYDESILSINDISYIINCIFRNKFDVPIET